MAKTRVKSKVDAVTAEEFMKIDFSKSRNKAKPEHLRDTEDTFISDIERGLQIDEHSLDEALQQQPDLFYRVAKRLALQISRRDEAKWQLGTTEAEVDALIRQTAAKAEEKITEREVDARKRMHPDVEEANTQLLRLGKSVGVLSALKEAFQQRSYVLKDLVSLHISNYYSDKTDDTSLMRNRATQQPDVARRRMNEERNRRGA